MNNFGKIVGYVLAIAVVVLLLVQVNMLSRVGVSGPGVFGGSTSADWNVGGDLNVTGDTALTGDLAVAGAFDATGAVSGLYLTEALGAEDRTLTAADSGTTFLLSGATSTITLPATTTDAGVFYRFMISGAITIDKTIVTSDGGNDIEGTLIVAGAVVDCDAEDTITFVADGENLGDYFEIMSDGSQWLLLDSGALTASKLTCSAS